MSKFDLRSQVQKLRKQGYSLNEICAQVPISKSTASLWCQGILLTERQTRRLEKRAKIKNYEAILRGAQTNKRKSENVKKEENEKARSFIGALSDREICLIGTALYWAEGHKTGSVFGVVNSDWHIILVTMKWLELEFKITTTDYFPRLFINSLYKDQEKNIRSYWSKQTGIPVSQFRNTIFIQSTFKKKFNTHKGYTGVMHLRIKSSSKMFYRTLSQIEQIKAEILKNN